MFCLVFFLINLFAFDIPRDCFLVLSLVLPKFGLLTKLFIVQVTLDAVLNYKFRGWYSTCSRNAVGSALLDINPGATPVRVLPAVNMLNHRQPYLYKY